MAASETKVKDLETKGNTEAQESSGKSLVDDNVPQQSEESSDTGGTKEYVLTDNLFYHNEGGRMKRYRKGQTLSLTENEAKTLLAEPRPSVREVS